MGKPKSGLQQDDLTPSTLPSDHTIVKLGAAQGSGNYMSSDAEGNERLVELSGRVKRSKIIITRGMSSTILQVSYPTKGDDRRRIRIGLGIRVWRLWIMVHVLMCSSGVGSELTVN